MMGISNGKDIAYGLKSHSLSLVFDRTEVKLALTSQHKNFIKIWQPKAGLVQYTVQ